MAVDVLVAVMFEGNVVCYAPFSVAGRIRISAVKKIPSRCCRTTNGGMTIIRYKSRVYPKYLQNRGSKAAG